MVDESYENAFVNGVDEFYALSARREELNKELEEVEDRMEKVRQGVIALAPLAQVDFDMMREEHPDLFEGQTDPRIGITEAVREVLRSSERALLPISIRDQVFRISPAVAGHKSPMASIHAVLRRLIEAGDIIMLTDPASRTLYGWVPEDEKQAIERLTDYLDGNRRKAETAWQGIYKLRKK